MAGECRPQSVVQVAAQPAPFLLTSEHEPLDCPLEISPEATGMQHTAEVPGEVIEQAAVSSTQRRRGWAVSEGPDRSPYAAKRERRDVGILLGRRETSRDHWPSSSQMATSSRPRPPSSLMTSSSKRSTSTVASRRWPRSAEHLVGLVPPSERQAVHRSLQRVTQRREDTATIAAAAHGNQATWPETWSIAVAPAMKSA